MTVLKTEQDMVGKTIERVIETNFDELGIKFTDGSYILLDADADVDGYASVVVGDPTDFDLVEAGLLTEEERLKREKDREEISFNMMKEDEFREYLRLKDKFEGK